MILKTFRFFLFTPGKIQLILICDLFGILLKLIFSVAWVRNFKQESILKTHRILFQVLLT